MLSGFAWRCSAAILLLTITVCAQQPEVVPAVPAAEQLKLRNLQFEQDKKLIEMQRIEARYRELQAGIQNDHEAIENLVRAIMKGANVDPARYLLDLDQLIFVPRPERTVREEKSNEKH